MYRCRVTTANEEFAALEWPSELAMMPAPREWIHTLDGTRRTKILAVGHGHDEVGPLVTVEV